MGRGMPRILCPSSDEDFTHEGSILGIDLPRGVMELMLRATAG